MDLGDRIVAGFNDAVAQLVAALPGIIGALVILLIGWILSGILGGLVTRLLRGAGADRLFAQHAGNVYGPNAQSFTPSRVAGEVVKWLIRIVAIIAAVNSLA